LNKQRDNPIKERGREGEGREEGGRKEGGDRMTYAEEIQRDLL